METIQQFLHQLGRLFTWWFVVVPWEQALRVRVGRYIKVLTPGIYLMIPYIDLIYKQSIRRRVSNSDMQTLSTKDNSTISLAVQIVYAIGDIRKLYDTLHHPEDTILALTKSGVSSFVTNSRIEECMPGDIERYLKSEVDLSQFGLTEVDFFVTNFVVVKTYRLIMDKISEYASGEILQTDRHEGRY